jgi:hypothetical protein
LHCAGNRKEEIASVNRHSGYVLCLNESGDKIWTRQYGGMWAHQVLDGCFTTQGDFLFVVDFGSEFYIGDGNQPLPAGIPEKPEGATSGFAWARLDPGGDLLDLDFHTGQTGAHGTRSRFIEQLPDGAFVMGGEFTNVLDFKERDSKGMSVKGQPLNHNAWQGVFMGDGTLESLWKPCVPTARNIKCCALNLHTTKINSGHELIDFFANHSSSWTIVFVNSIYCF